MNLLEQAAKAQPKVDWKKVDDGISALVEKKLAQKLKPARWPWALACAGVAVAVLMFVFREAPAPAPVLAVAANVEQLPDGSELTRGPAAQLQVMKATTDEVRLSLSSGKVDVRASHRARRAFVVESGDVKVFVVGTVFAVSRVGAQTLVQVSEGKVRVDQGKTVRFVAAGESLEFSPLPPKPTPHVHPQLRAVMVEAPAEVPVEAPPAVVEVTAPPLVQAFVPPDMETRFLEQAENALNRGRCERFMPGLDELRLDVEAPERASRAQQLFNLCRERLRQDREE